MATFSSGYNDYRLGTSIVGWGAASIVYSASYTPSPLSTGGLKPAICAIKISGRHPDVDQWLEEVRILSSCRHPNVLQIYSAFTVPPEHSQVAIVTPLIAGGSLLSLMAWRKSLSSDVATSGLFRSMSGRGRQTQNISLSRGRLTEEEVRVVLKQVLCGLGYLHSQGIIHRDIKAGNILLDSDGTVLLADLGIGVRTTGVEEGSPGLAGSPCWMSPEVVRGAMGDQKSDIWSLGITLIELSTGLVPLCHLPPAKIMAQIAIASPPTLPPSCEASKPYLAFVSSCLIKDPSGRSSVHELEPHPFLRNSRKPAWLAASLLKDVPPLAYRQEARRKPSQQSLHSLASSWNFTPTPSGSKCNTPIRPNNRLPRSPSASTSISGHSLLVAPVIRRRKSVSRSSTGYSLPPSPQAKISRPSWLSSASEFRERPGGDSGGGRGRRSEPGRKRPTSLAESPYLASSEHNTSMPEHFDLCQAGNPTNAAQYVSALALSAPMVPSMTTQSAESDPRPVTPPNDGLLGQDVTIAGSPPDGQGDQGRKGFFGRKMSMKADRQEEGSRFSRVLKGWRRD